MKKKVCKKCKYFFEGDECPLCKSNVAASSWQGRLNIIDANKSAVAKKVNEIGRASCRERV